MGIDELRETWAGHGDTDALWAVLSEPGKRGNRWDPDEFFSTGRRTVDGFMREFAELGLPESRDRCLDFGCGVGRLTQALAEHFGECDGVDIAASMIARAREFNRFGARVRYHANEAPDLRLFADDTFDLVFTYLVLQHVPPEITSSYLPEFVRVMKPGGLAVIHVPGGRASDFQGPVPMADAAYRSSVEIRRFPRKLFAGGLAPCRVRVRNTSPIAWPLRREGRWINVGDHWLDAEGNSVVVFDDERGHFPCDRDLAPGESVEVEFEVRVPDTRDPRLTVEFDVVHEGVSWFGSRDGTTARKRVKIRVPKRPIKRTTAPGEEPWSMYYIPKEEVVNLLDAAGGTVIRLREEDVGDFHDCTYYVTKRRESSD